MKTADELSNRLSFWRPDMPTFNVTFNYLGRDWFMCAEKCWTDQPSRASQYINGQAAGAALAKARRYMRNKQVEARIVASTSQVEAPSFDRDIGEEGVSPNAVRVHPPRGPVQSAIRECAVSRFRG